MTTQTTLTKPKPKPKRKKPNRDASDGIPLPHDHTLERKTLSLCLAVPEKVEDTGILASDFYTPEHRELFVTILRLYQRDGQVLPTSNLKDAIQQSARLRNAWNREFVASLFDPDMVTDRATLKRYGQALRNLSTRRDLWCYHQQGLRALQNGKTPDELLDSTLDQAKELHQGRTKPVAFKNATYTARQAIARDIPPTPSVFGDGTLKASQLGILYGPPGTRKSLLSLHLAEAVATGGRFLDLPTARMNVGIVNLEVPPDVFQERLKAIMGDDAPDNLFTICRHDLPGPLDLNDPSCLNDLEAWIRHYELGFVIFDPLSRAHTGGEFADEISPLLMALETIRIDTGAAMLLVHHTRKPPNGKEDDDIAAIRGTGRLASDPTLLMRMVVTRNRHELRFVKVNLGPPLDPVFLSWEGVNFELTDKPPDSAEAKAERLEDLRVMLEEAGDQGVKARDAADALGVTERTVKRYLAELGAEGGVSGCKNSTWSLFEGGVQDAVQDDSGK